MEPEKFVHCLLSTAADLVGELNNFPDLPRGRVYEIVGMFENFLKQSTINVLFEQIIQRLQTLGDTKEHLIIYHHMLQSIQKAFENVRTENQFLKYLANSGTYVPPVEIKVMKECTKGAIQNKADNDVMPNDDAITVQVIPVRHVLKKFLELPGMYEITMSYLSDLEKQENVLTNIVQGECWKERQKSFDDRIVVPLVVYQDDFETNNPLGSHRGVGKVGGVYIVIPCLPPHLISKIENIFVLLLYKSSDQHLVSLENIYASALKELHFLETEGIEVSTESGKYKVYFSFAAAIGNNLAIHFLFGFMKGFTAHYPCRFCMIHSSDINSTFSETSCTLRTHSNYLQHVAQDDPGRTGVSGVPVFYNLQSAATMDILVVDPMHDIFEGFWQHDVGQILHKFIVIDKIFTCDDLNERLNKFDYGHDEGRNKPRPITLAQVKNKFIKMSASESLCFSRNICVLIGDLVARENEYWRVLILLTEIINIVMAPAITEGITHYFASLIHDYLSLVVSLFPNCLKPKHHFLLHYPRIMRRFGPVCNLSTFRCESKNRNLKITSHVALSRVNVCKTLAVKNQLQLSQRFRRNESAVDPVYKISGKTTFSAMQDLPEIHYFFSLLSMQPSDKINVLETIVHHNQTITKGVALSLPGTEFEQFFLVHLILQKDDRNVSIIAKEITNDTQFDEHFQSYLFEENAMTSPHAWRCIKIEELRNFSISRAMKTGTSKHCIPKRWI